MQIEKQENLMRLKISMSILAIFVSLFVAAQKEMSYDGYYLSTPDSNSINMFKYYLRFYPDGTVIGVTTAGKPANLIPWFKKENKTPSRGKYMLTDSTIKFSMTSEQGDVNYEGKLTADNNLVLKVKSLINKYEGKEEYGFLKMDAIKTEPTAETGNSKVKSQN
jgi:hypothetical protein